MKKKGLEIPHNYFSNCTGICIQEFTNRPLYCAGIQRFDLRIMQIASFMQVKDK